VPRWTVSVRENVDRYLLAAAIVFAAVFARPFSHPAIVVGYVAGALGLAVLHERLRSEFAPVVALTTTLLVFGASPLFWGMTHDELPLNALGFAAVVVILAIAERWTVRWRIVAWSLAAGLTLGTQYFVRGASVDQSIATIERWLAPLYSSSHGFLALTPVAYIALIGTFAYLRRNTVWAASAVIVFVFVIVLFGALFGASAPGPFQHGLTSTLPMLAPGLALIVDMVRRRPLVAVAPVIGMAIYWNYLLMVQYTVGMLPKDEPVSFTAMVRQQAEVHARSPYVYAFALPANIWFGWREGVPRDRYDRLALEPRRESIDLTMDRSTDPFLLEGWDAPGPDTLGRVRWIGGERATILLPLDVHSGRTAQISVVARTRLEEPAVEAELGVELNGHEIGRFVAPASAPTDAVLTIPASAVGRILRTGYNRLTFVSYGVRRVDPSDKRPPGPLASERGARVWPVAIYHVRVGFQ